MLIITTEVYKTEIICIGELWSIGPGNIGTGEHSADHIYLGLLLYVTALNLFICIDRFKEALKGHYILSCDYVYVKSCI